MQASASDLSDAGSVPGSGQKKKVSRQTLHHPSPSVPITITKAAPSVATASGTSSTDIASSASSISDYHSTQSPTASALLAHLSPRARSRSRANSVTSSTDDAPSDTRAGHGFAVGADTSSDAESLQTTLRHRRRPSGSTGPALLRQRPASIATTASSVTAFDIGALEDGTDAQSVVSTSAKPYDAADDTSASPSASRRPKSKSKASSSTLRPRASPRVAESHLSPATLQVPPLELSASTAAAADKLRKLQHASASGSKQSRPSHKAPKEAQQVLHVDSKHDGFTTPPVPAGHSEALLQEDAQRRAEAAEVATLVDEQIVREHVDDNAQKSQNRLSLGSADDNDSQTSRSISSQLRRRRGYRALHKRPSQSSLSDTDDDSGPRTSSSSLDERLSNVMYTKSKSASRIWPKPVKRSPEPDESSDQPSTMTAIEKQIKEDSDRIRLANQGLMNHTLQDDSKIALNVSLHFQVPGLATLTRSLVQSVIPVSSSPASDCLSTTKEKSIRPSTRRQPDLLKHQFRRQEIHLTEYILDKRSTAVKLMVLGVLFGSWFGRTIGLL